MTHLPNFVADFIGAEIKPSWGLFFSRDKRLRSLLTRSLMCAHRHNTGADSPQTPVVIFYVRQSGGRDPNRYQV